MLIAKLPECDLAPPGKSISLLKFRLTLVPTQPRRAGSKKEKTAKDELQEMGPWCGATVCLNLAEESSSGETLFLDVVPNSIAGGQSSAQNRNEEQLSDALEEPQVESAGNHICSCMADLGARCSFKTVFTTSKAVGLILEPPRELFFGSNSALVGTQEACLPVVHPQHFPIEQLTIQLRLFNLALSVEMQRRHIRDTFEYRLDSAALEKPDYDIYVSDASRTDTYEVPEGWTLDESETERVIVDILNQSGPTAASANFKVHPSKGKVDFSGAVQSMCLSSGQSVAERLVSGRLVANCTIYLMSKEKFPVTTVVGLGVLSAKMSCAPSKKHGRFVGQATSIIFRPGESFPILSSVSRPRSSPKREERDNRYREVIVERILNSFSGGT